MEQWEPAAPANRIDFWVSDLSVFLRLQSALEITWRACENKDVWPLPQSF